MLDLCLVTGFLGSGKTTLLRHFADQLRDRRVAYLVNEFSSVDVDGRLLTEALRSTDSPPDEAGMPQVVTIAGGSIFCQCKAGQFIYHLSALRSFGPARGLAGVIIEASGMANPRVINRMLAETQLDRDYRVTRVVAVVDPGSFGKLLQTLPNIRDQIEAADTVLINKCDLFEADVVDEVDAAVRRINDRAEVMRTEHAKATFDPFGPNHESTLAGEYAACVDPNYATLTVDVPGGVEIDTLRQMLDEMSEYLYRAKGRVTTNRGAVDVEYTKTALSFEPVEANEASSLSHGELVLIIKGSCVATATQVAERLTQHQTPA